MISTLYTSTLLSSCPLCPPTIPTTCPQGLSLSVFCNCCMSCLQTVFTTCPTESPAERAWDRSSLRLRQLRVCHCQQGGNDGPPLHAHPHLHHHRRRRHRHHHHRSVSPHPHRRCHDNHCCYATVRVHAVWVFHPHHEHPGRPRRFPQHWRRG